MNQETGTAVHTEPPAAPAARWAIVEIMGHRIVVHVREITRAMLPAPAKAPPRAAAAAPAGPQPGPEAKKAETPKGGAGARPRRQPDESYPRSPGGME